MTIVSVDNDKNTCTIKLANDETVEFKMDSDTSLAAGYIPQAGDVVNISYSKDDMLLKDIDLKDRPAPADSGGGDAQ